MAKPWVTPDTVIGAAASNGDHKPKTGKGN